MKCPYCSKKAIWCANERIYGRRYGRSYMVYLCEDCDAYVGCHNNTKKSLGTMADRELRMMRRQVHEVLDPLWQYDHYTRDEVYKRLADAFGEEVHVGQSDMQRCQELIDKIPNLF